MNIRDYKTGLDKQAQVVEDRYINLFDIVTDKQPRTVVWVKS